jgi:hypothetical protein
LSIVSLTLKQGENILEKSYSLQPEEKLSKESERNYGLNPIGENTTEALKTHGHDAFRREILRLCKTKGQCSYFEAKLQFEYGVLEHPEKFYNTWIMCRIHQKHLKL